MSEPQDQDYMLIISELVEYTKIFQLKLVDDIEKFCKSFPKIIDDLRGFIN